MQMEIYLFLKAIILGSILDGFYLIIRCFRRLAKPGIMRLTIEDIIYFIVAALIISRCLYLWNALIIRGYIICGIIVGIVLFEQSIGEIIMCIISKIHVKIHLRH